jgi:hypothetical protein
MKTILALVAVLGIAIFSIGEAHAVGPLRAVGVQAGYVSPDNADATWVAGLFFDIGVPATNIALQPFVNYWTQSFESFDASGDFSDWTVGGNLKYQIPTPALNIHPYLAGGVSAHLTSASIDALSFDESDTKFGWQVGGGAMWDTGERWGLHAEGWYHGVEDLNHWSARGGVQFRL